MKARVAVITVFIIFSHVVIKHTQVFINMIKIIPCGGTAHVQRP